MNKTIETEFDNQILSICINRPEKKNSLTYNEFCELTKIIENATIDDNVKVIIISSKGDVFCAGIDFTTYIETPFPKVISQVGKLFSAFIECTKVILVAVNGKAIGIGVTMLLLSDCIFCTDNSSFYTPFLKVGLYPEGCSSYLFSRRLGNSVTSHLMFADGEITSKTAKDLGLVLDIYPKEEMSKKVKDYGLRICKNSAKRLKEFKKMLRENDKEKLKEVNNNEMKMMLMSSENSQEFQNTLAFYKKPKF